jgi:CRP-like cAMP-binding protein
MLKELRWDVYDPLRRKMLCLGVSERDISGILPNIRVGSRLERGDEILPAGHGAQRSTVLMEGIACLYERFADGSRQIYSFQYAGDFCDLGLHVLQAPNVGVAAVTDCKIGYIEKHVLEQMLIQYPALGMAVWRYTMLEAVCLRARLAGSRQPALQYVAHLLCEQLLRQAAAGIENAVIPISQVDLADAAGLSTVHINRTFKELQRLGLISRVGRSMEVVDRAGLARLANFDGSYLNMPQLLSKWRVTL